MWQLDKKSPHVASCISFSDTCSVEEVVERTALDVKKVDRRDFYISIAIFFVRGSFQGRPQDRIVTSRGLVQLTTLSAEEPSRLLSRDWPIINSSPTSSYSSISFPPFQSAFNTFFSHYLPSTRSWTNKLVRACYRATRLDTRVLRRNPLSRNIGNGPTCGPWCMTSSALFMVNNNFRNH